MGEKGTATYRTHPLTIFANLWRVLYLTIIPVLRGFMLALQGNLSSWVQGAWIDILIFLLMIALAVWRWRLVYLRCDDRHVILESGLLLYRKIWIKWENITTLSVVESFYLRPFRAAKLRVDTLGGGPGQSDFSILVNRDVARLILEQRRMRGGEDAVREYAPKLWSVVALALLTSNSLGGIIFVATFISQSGKLLGNEFSDRLIGTFEEVTRLLAFGLPPAAAAIAYMLLIGWIISFLLTFCRYKDFTVRRGKSTLYIQGGIFTKRNYRIRYQDVTFVDIRQSISTKLLNLYSLYIYAVGYGKHRDDISCIIPTEQEKLFRKHHEKLFPAFMPADRQVSPHFQGIFRFIGEPLSLCAAIAVAMALFVWRFPGWQDFILFVGLMLMIPAILFLIVRTVEWSTGGFAKKGQYYTMRYSSGFSIHTVVVPAQKVVRIELRQSPLQQFSSNCDLLISTHAEVRYTHRCKNLDMVRLQQLLDM